METAVEHMIGFSVALTGIIVLLAMIGLEVRKIDRQLAISVWLLAADAEWCLATAFLCVVDPGGGGTRPPIIVEVRRPLVRRPQACYHSRQRQFAVHLGEFLTSL